MFKCSVGTTFFLLGKIGVTDTLHLNTETLPMYHIAITQIFAIVKQYLDRFLFDKERQIATHPQNRVYKVIEYFSPSRNQHLITSKITVLYSSLHEHQNSDGCKLQARTQYVLPEDTAIWEVILQHSFCAGGFVGCPRLNSLPLEWQSFFVCLLHCLSHDSDPSPAHQ